ncbi:hypothetical protein [Candidatus Albibeggiatoa sp. nov. NOAA]|uniref:hypothetical protein n=1 Tax=Candidatus Albibeggiatoa sp. nov. NOAA TaxID=3162724 RepID=UPI0032F1AD01|nr:hypothetical protein [Thiotrichaceae bacterium]
MNKWSVIFLLFCTYAVQAEEVYLEGISFLGSAKKAYVVMDDVQMSVEQGDELGQWIIKDIQQRAMLLVNRAGEEQLLELYSKLDVASTYEGAVADDPFAQTVDTEVQPSEILQKMPDGNPFAAKSHIADDEIPEGKRKVSTPFGDFLVDDVAPEPEQTQLLQQSDEKVEAAFEQAIESNESSAHIEGNTFNNNDETNDHPVIHTPFGDLPVNATE